MSFEHSKLANGAILDLVLPQHQKVSLAPASIDHYGEAAMAQERLIKYKAVDSSGNIYLMQNPSTWEIVVKNGVEVKIRPKPELVMTASEALVAAGLKKTKKPKDEKYSY